MSAAIVGLAILLFGGSNFTAKANSVDDLRLQQQYQYNQQQAQQMQQQQQQQFQQQRDRLNNLQTNPQKW